ncbi:hypothetical protein [Companilactobacillus nodensis]|uniref:Uncharacterized protein n=1 Tax=Companilactobacillus nodensis DSM 19682 = JCM 14932 = NBRC 107160 TaxID=1423775 RepID=A0A0R1K732_9LACO|nr:hypothetical protein [Companilactobacillus nodensis]KRK79244.1 hypothetical protein FD03_GL001610 [Companilactobacillus nodensis DSM 19682 = JCM 14932 = NBRC 107160]
MLRNDKFTINVKADIKVNERTEEERKEIIKRSEDKVFSNPEVLAALKELSKM